MSDLEQIVRPAQNYDFRPPSNFTSRQPVASPSSKVVSWGSSGANIFQLQASISQQASKAQWPKDDEEKRTYDVVQVSSADDPDTKLTLESMTQYQAKNKIDGSRITLNFNRVQSSQDVQIISTNNVRSSGS